MPFPTPAPSSMLPYIARYTLRVRNPAGAFVDMLGGVSRISIVKRYNMCSDWVLECYLSNPISALLMTPGYGIRVLRTLYDSKTRAQIASNVEIDGPILEFTQNMKSQLLTVHGRDDMQLLAATEAYPVVNNNYDAFALTTGPTVYYTFDENYGSTFYNKARYVPVGGFPGTYIGGPTLGVAGALVSAPLTTGATFVAASSQYMQLVQPPMQQVNNPLTVEAWFKVVANPAANAMISSYGDDSVSHQTVEMYIDTTGHLVGSVTGFATTPGAAVGLGVWHHAVTTWDGTTLSTYLDGLPYGTPATPGANNIPGVTWFNIGAAARSAPTNFFGGSIDEAAAYDGAMSSTRVLAHYIAGAFAGPAHNAYDSNVSPDAPTNNWKMEDASLSTTVIDSGSSPLPMTVNGSVTFQTQGPPDVDLADPNWNSATFDGSTGFLSHTFSATLNPAQWTIEFWAYVTGGQSTDRAIFESRDTNTNKGILVYAASTNTWAALLYNGTTNFFINGGSVTPNVWTHVVATFDGSICRVYVNGQNVSTSGAIAYAPNTVQSTLIGRQNPVGLSFPGTLSRVALYSSAISATRVLAHYLAGTPVNMAANVQFDQTVVPDRPLAYWRLEDAALSATVVDGGIGSPAVSPMTVNGGVTLQSPVALQVSGPIGRGGLPLLDPNWHGAAFNGTTGYLSRAFNAFLNPAQWTIEAWVFVTGGQGTFRVIFGNQDTAANKGFTLYVSNGNVWAINVFNGTTGTGLGGGTARLNAWTHIAVTFDGTNVRFYNNGILTGGPVAVAYVPQTTQQTTIGRQNDSAASFFNGTISRVALYGNALSAARIQLHATAPFTSMVTDSTVPLYAWTVRSDLPGLYYRLEEGPGALTAADSAGSGIFNAFIFSGTNFTLQQPPVLGDNWGAATRLGLATPWTPDTYTFTQQRAVQGNDFTIVVFYRPTGLSLARDTGGYWRTGLPLISTESGHGGFHEWGLSLGTFNGVPGALMAGTCSPGQPDVTVGTPIPADDTQGTTMYMAILRRTKSTGLVEVGLNGVMYNGANGSTQQLQPIFSMMIARHNNTTLGNVFTVQSVLMYNSVITNDTILNIWRAAQSRFGQGDNDAQSGDAETIMRYYVNANCITPSPDPTGTPRARAMSLQPVNAHQGSFVNAAARFDQLVDANNTGLLQVIADAGGVGFKMTRVANVPQFQVFIPTDRTASAIFSTTLGNLLDFTYGAGGPDPLQNQGNAMVAGMQGTGSLRQMITSDNFSSTSAWGRVEGFIDARDTDDPTVATSRINAAIGTDTSHVVFSAALSQTGNTLYGRDFFVGDKVSIQVGTTSLHELVREVSIDVQGNTPEVVNPQVTSFSRVPITDPISRQIKRAIANTTKVGLVERHT